MTTPSFIQMQRNQFPDPIGDGGVSTVGNQNTDVTAVEYWETREIEETLQSRRMVQRFVVDGNSDQAYNDIGLAGFRLGDPHPWAANADPGPLAQDLFCTRRTFQHANNSPEKSEQKTIVTLVYEARTCPFLYEEVGDTAYQSYPMWYSASSPPQALAFPMNPITLQLPVDVMIRRWLNVKLDENAVYALKKLKGSRNPQPFAGEDIGVWLLDSIKTRRLWGAPNAASSNPGPESWEISLSFRSDPHRHHEYWTPDTNGTAVLESITGPPDPNTIVPHYSLRSLHNVRELFPLCPKSFDELLPLNETGCQAVYSPGS